jgi:phenylpropionate dioxygenase-like ring-hydroxylating dioxygenase large terminal subunit
MATAFQPSSFDPSAFVTDTHVHRSLYTSPDIFRMEMRRIFGRAWVYLGHESEIANAGDYVTRHIGTQGVIVTRGNDGEVHVIPNRCSHRGVTLCSFDSGNARGGHICPYHGWSFSASGKLKAVSHKVNYEGVLANEDYDLTPVRTESYRGFLFGCLEDEAMPLVDYLGHMTTTIDDLVDRSPTGRVTCDPYVLRHFYRANWKMTFENLNDTIHPGFAHAASVVSAKHVVGQLAEDQRMAPSIGMMMANGKPISFFQQLDMITVPGGHSYIGGHMGADYTPDTQDQYTQDLIDFHGEEKARAVLGTDRHVMLLYPSSSWHARYQTVRIIRPVRHDLTEVIGFTFRLEGAPEETHVNAIEYCTGANSAASPVISDDLEIYERLLTGNAYGDLDWIPMSRGLLEDREHANDKKRMPSTSEGYIRNQYAAWAQLMAQE